ncbi:putative serine/threonine-protein kinase iks1 [Zalaria obscura]|uniref:Serine/threonine-protein kinase iks1 n=1 Tax=Zalaria obscura TaxID=2024903 RepID=A0ACC3SPY0_9PEZI
MPHYDDEEVLDVPEPGFVNPEYFRMLAHSTPGSVSSSRPGSPRKQLPQPVFGTPPREPRTVTPPPGAEFVGSAPAPEHGISGSSFLPDYFRKFFREKRELGRGGRGVVLLVEHLLDGVSLGEFACKRIPVGNDHAWLEKVLAEVQLLQQLRHQNLVSYNYVWLEDAQITNFGPSVPCVFILQQYCNSGDLHDHVLSGIAKTPLTPRDLKDRLRRRSKGQPESPTGLQGPRKMNFDDIFSFFRDITSGLHHLHANGYIHRDLKPSNCLLHHDRKTGKMTVLVSDFGEVQSTTAQRTSTGSTGTISYCAPEVLKRATPDGVFGNFSTKSDIFSLGMIVYFMCFASLPYANADNLHEENEDVELLRAEIARWSGFDDTAKPRSDLPERLYRFLRRLLSLDPAERPSTEEILTGIKSGGGAGGDDIAAGAGLGIGMGMGMGNADEARTRISAVDSPAPKARSRPDGPPPSLLRPGLNQRRRHSSKDDGRPPSPKTQPQTQPRGDAAALESSVVLRTRKVSMPLPAPPPLRTPAPSPSPSPSQTQMQMQPPQLMLPAPPTWRGLLVSRTSHLLSHPSTQLSLRLLVFLVKVISLHYPCAPYGTSPWLLYPLLCVAAWDFREMGVVGRGWGGSLLLLGLHLAVVVTAGRWGRLCGGKVMVWEEF